MLIAPEQLEEILKLIENANNLVAASHLRVRPEIHVEGMRGGIVDMELSLRALYTGITGKSPDVEDEE